VRHLINCIVVSAGLAGATIAEQLANKYSQNVLAIESRFNVAWHCYDKLDQIWDTFAHVRSSLISHRQFKGLELSITFY